MDGPQASLAALLRHADIELDEPRRAALVPLLEQVGAAIAAIRRVDVGELPPATAFDARWE